MFTLVCDPSLIYQSFKHGDHLKSAG